LAYHISPRNAKQEPDFRKKKMERRSVYVRRDQTVQKRGRAMGGEKIKRDGKTLSRLVGPHVNRTDKREEKAIRKRRGSLKSVSNLRRNTLQDRIKVPAPGNGKRNVIVVTSMMTPPSDVRPKKGNGRKWESTNKETHSALIGKEHNITIGGSEGKREY